MRFFEYANGNLPVYDLEKKYFSEWIANGQSLAESPEDDAKTQEVRNFINHHVTDIKTLTVGDKYYPVTMIARPVASSITVEVANSPLVYAGTDDDHFIFHGNMQFKLPIHSDNVEDFGPYMITTTVYTTASEVNQFLTLIQLKFSGDWKLTQKRLPT